MLLLALIVLALSRPDARAAVYTVNTTADTYDGVCDAADCSLKDAIDAAVSSPGADTVTLANATYTVTTPFSPGVAVPLITDDVSIVGNGAIIQRDPTASAFRLFTVQSGATLSLQGVTVRNGSAADGGGINSIFGTVTLIDTVIETNTATQNGGGVYFSGPGLLTITRCSFRNNTAQAGGGGLFVINFVNPAQAQIADSAFVGNMVLDAVNGIGGGVEFSADVDATVVSTTFSGNSSATMGGAVGFNQVPVARIIELRNVTIVQNSAGQIGGGLAAASCSQNCPNVTKPKLTNTILANNTAGFPNTANCVTTYDSGGNNILGPPIMQSINCNVLNQANEILLTGTLANVAALTTTGAPGGEHHDLLAGNVGINTANPALCPATDQIGASRVLTCERGAIEFRTPTPTVNPCSRHKKLCAAKKVEALLKCHAKAEKQGVAVDPLCLQAGFDKFKKCCTKAETLGPCTTSCTCDQLESRIDAFVLGAVQALDPGYPTPVQNVCSAKKKKCTAQKAIALLECHAKAEQTGAFSPKCFGKAHAAFDGGGIPANSCFAPLEAAGNCLTVGDTSPIEALVDDFVDDIVCCVDPQSGTCS